MKMLRSRGAAAIAAFAALSMTATPVLARGHGGWDRHYRHHHGNGIDGGDVLAGLLIVGGIAAIASAAGKSARDDRADERGRYPESPDYSKPQDRDYSETPGRNDDEAVPDYGSDDRDYSEAGRNDDDGVSDYGSDDSAAAPARGSFDDAVGRCEDELERGERRIGSVDNVSSAGDRYSVEGRLEDGRGFACSVDRDGQVRSVAVDGRALI